MECSSQGYVTFLMCCNVALMLVGVSVLVLGVKMEQLLSALLLLTLPMVGRAVKAVIATGVLVSVAGCTGLVGACNGSPLMLKAHVFSLGAIVLLEFGVGVTLLVVRQTVENYLGNTACDSRCASTLDALVLDYALPAAGLMLTIIIVEAVMMYSALKVLSHIRERPKIVVEEHDVQMQRVASPFPPRFSPRLDRTFLASPHSDYPPLHHHSPDGNFFNTSPQQWYTPDPTASSPYRHRASPYMHISSPYALSSPYNAALKPPQYVSLSQQPPPSYVEAVPEATVGSRLAPPQTPLKRSSSCSSV